MSGIDNLFQEETLLSNIKIAAYFILLYEHFEDVVISTVKEFYAHDCVLNGQLFLSIDDMPIMEIKLPKEVKPDDVMGGDDAVLESMFRILFCGEGPQFKEALEKESAKLLFKQQR